MTNLLAASDSNKVPNHMKSDYGDEKYDQSNMYNEENTIRPSGFDEAERAMMNKGNGGTDNG